MKLATRGARRLQAGALGALLLLLCATASGCGSSNHPQSSRSAAAAPPAASSPSGNVVMAFDIGYAHDPNMPWASLTSADLFALETQNGTGLDTHFLTNVNVAAWVAAAHSHGVKAFITI